MLKKTFLLFQNKSKISSRFRIINILLFAIISIVISVVMLLALSNITSTVSRDYAELYSSNTVGTLNTNFVSQIALIKKAARSNAVIEWFADEENKEKKLAAYQEMMEIIDTLHSKNLYIGIEKTFHEFTVEENFTVDDIKSFATLDPQYYDDAWYFECTTSDKDYQLNVDVDKIMQRKRVWLNYKVTRGEEVLGVICTWLEFSDLVEKLFSEYDSKNIRGLVIDENGIIHMDSYLLGDENFLNYTIENEKHISEEFSNEDFLFPANQYLSAIDGYFDFEGDTTVLELSKWRYHYATIAPIASTTWSVVTFYDASSLFGLIKLLPLMTIILAMFIIFIVATNLASNKLIFEPIEKLTRSISKVKSNYHEHVYGIERSDEIGDIANTVENIKETLLDALDKVHYDVVTGIYNRRFLDENLDHIVKSLSRSGGVLSVIMIDVDFFKNYNDTYGHDMGDACLKILATAISESICRSGDFAARYGGEEFAVVLPNTDKWGACTIAKKLIRNINRCDVPHKKSSVASHVTVSLGVATGYAGCPITPEDYIKAADKALYVSKQDGRNRFTFSSVDNTVKGNLL